MQALIITGSPRHGGNLSTYAGILADELSRLGLGYETVNLYDLKLGPCRSCDACAATGTCVFKDDLVGLAGRMLAADLLVLATPVYWFSVSGVMKTLMDRTQSLWHGRQLAGKACAALITEAHAGAVQTCALLESFSDYHDMRWLGCSTVRTRDQRDLVAGSDELQAQARAFARELHAAITAAPDSGPGADR